MNSSTQNNIQLPRDVEFEFTMFKMMNHRVSVYDVQMNHPFSLITANQTVTVSLLSDANKQMIVKIMNHPLLINDCQRSSPPVINQDV